jgi:hypothetical protein
VVVVNVVVDELSIIEKVDDKNQTRTRTADIKTSHHITRHFTTLHYTSRHLPYA